MVFTGFFHSLNLPSTSAPVNEISSFTYTTTSITITKTLSDATDWSWTLNGVSQGTVAGAPGLTQVYNLPSGRFYNGDVIVVTMNSSSVTNTLSGLSTVSKTLAFLYGNFDNAYGDGNVTSATNNGRLYANSPTGTYSWGTLNSRSTSGSNTVYTWTPLRALTGTKVLMIAGGGGGGRRTGGGGGAGGMVFRQNQSFSSGVQTVRVGNGGTGSTSRYAMGTRGVNSTCTGVTTAIGGGAGCCDTHQVQSTANGGSGGGAEWNVNLFGVSTQSSGYGNNGGSSDATRVGGAGGGGASAAGGSSTSGTGFGGDGHYQVTISGTTYNFQSTFGGSYGDQISGQAWFAGGGGGGTFRGSYPTPIGGKGGGGDGGVITSSNPTVGQAHTGGGGGGDGRDVANGANGGSGIVLLRFSL